MKYGDIYLATDKEIEIYGNHIIRTEPDISKIRPFKHDEIIINKNGKIKLNSRSNFVGWKCTETIGMTVINPRAFSIFNKE